MDLCLWVVKFFFFFFLVIQLLPSTLLPLTWNRKTRLCWGVRVHPAAGVRLWSFPWRAGFCYGDSSGFVSFSLPEAQGMVSLLSFVRTWWVHGGKPTPPTCGSPSMTAAIRGHLLLFLSTTSPFKHLTTLGLQWFLHQVRRGTAIIWIPLGLWILSWWFIAWIWSFDVAEKNCRF